MKDRLTSMDIRVQVKPGGSRDSVATQSDGSLLVRTTVKPIDGAANQAVVKLLAEFYGVSKSRVRLKKGHAARYKTFQIDLND